MSERQVLSPSYRALTQRYTWDLKGEESPLLQVLSKLDAATLQKIIQENELRNGMPIDSISIVYAALSKLILPIEYPTGEDWPFQARPDDAFIVPVLQSGLVRENPVILVERRPGIEGVVVNTINIHLVTRENTAMTYGQGWKRIEQNVLCLLSNPGGCRSQNSYQWDRLGPIPILENSGVNSVSLIGIVDGV